VGERSPRGGTAGAPAGPWVGTFAAWGAIATCCGFYLWRNVLAALPYLRSGPSDFTNYLLAARALVAGRSPFSVPNFDYPPLLAFLAVPLAGLPDATARLMWFVFGHLCLLAAAAIVWRRLGGDRVALVAVAAAWAFGGAVAENLVLGQVNPLLLLLLAGSLSAAWQARPLGAALLGAAAAIKLWPIAVLLKEATARRWRSLGAGLLTAAALLVGPWAFIAAILPPPHSPPRAGYWMGTPALLNFSVPAVALRLLEPPQGSGPLPSNWVVGNDPGQLALSPAHALAATATGALVFGVGVWLLARRAGRATAQGDHLAAAALVALALAAAPISWYQYQLLNVLGAAVLAERWLRGRRFAALTALACVVAAVSWTHGALLAPYIGRYGWTAANPVWLWAATSLVPIADLALFGMLLGELGRGRGPLATPGPGETPAPAMC
jgi:Glycosyltransferase family 87